MKTKWIFSLILIAVLPLSSLALTITRDSYSNTSDNGSVANGASVTGTALTGGASSSATIVGGSTSAMGARYYGAVSGRGVDNGSQQAQSLTQNISVSYTWAITAETWEVYDFSISTAFRGYLNILDDFSDESGDTASLSSLDAQLYLNGSQITLDQLGLSGGSRSTVGSSSADDTNSRALTGLSGNNTIELIYTGSATATWKIAGIQNNRTADAALWGANGIMDGDTFANTFDEYGTSIERTSDGLFVEGVATLQAVPEPASMLLIAIGGGLIALKRRFFSKV
jgi:hypothetical protein